MKVVKVVLSIFAVSFLFFWTQAWAHQTHKVKKGETLNKIAEAHGVTVKTLKEANHLSTSLIRTGKVLQIPESSSPASGVEKKTENQEAQEVSGELEPKEAVRLENHVVESGENLYRLSLRFGTTVKELIRMNHLKSKTLQIGQVLLVPSHEEEMADVAEVPVDNAETSSLEDGQSTPQDDPTTLLTNDKPSTDDDLDAYLSELSESNPEEEGESSLIAFARKYLGVPYRFGGENPKKGIDCSAFVQRVFRYFSIDLPRTAREQFKAGIKVSRNDLRVGDLIFFRTYARYPSHVGIYMGEGKMIHASSRYKKVTITSVDLPYYKKRFIGVIRVPDAENLLLSQSPAVFNQ